MGWGGSGLGRGVVRDFSNALIICSNTDWPDICWKLRLCLWLPDEVAGTLLLEIIPISSFLYE